MTDREKVLQGLYCCAANCQNGCPYSDISQYCSDVLAKDALELIKELLKEREPRLLTAEELTGDGECWLEHKNGACGYADCYMCTGRNSVEVWRCMAQGPSYLSWIDFNKTWRCWSARPTEEQREAVPWDA